MSSWPAARSSERKVFANSGRRIERAQIYVYDRTGRTALAAIVPFWIEKWENHSHITRWHCHVVRRLIRWRLMDSLDLKYLALLGDAERHERSEADDMRLCFEVLALASAIDRACAARLAPHRLSEGKFVLLLLLRDAPDGIAPHELASRAGVTRATVTVWSRRSRRDLPACLASSSSQ